MHEDDTVEIDIRDLWVLYKCRLCRYIITVFGSSLSPSMRWGWGRWHRLPPCCRPCSSSTSFLAGGRWRGGPWSNCCRRGGWGSPSTSRFRLSCWRRRSCWIAASCLWESWMFRSGLILASTAKVKRRITSIFGLVFWWVFEGPSCRLSSWRRRAVPLTVPSFLLLWCLSWLVTCLVLRWVFSDGLPASSRNWALLLSPPSRRRASHTPCWWGPRHVHPNRCYLKISGFIRCALNRGGVTFLLAHLPFKETGRGKGVGFCWVWRNQLSQSHVFSLGSTSRLEAYCYVLGLSLCICSICCWFSHFILLLQKRSENLPFFCFDPVLPLDTYSALRVHSFIGLAESSPSFAHAAYTPKYASLSFSIFALSSSRRSCLPAAESDPGALSLEFAEGLLNEGRITGRVLPFGMRLAFDLNIYVI